MAFIAKFSTILALKVKDDLFAGMGCYNELKFLFLPFI